VPVNAPPAALEVVAVHAVVPADVHVTVRAWPRSRVAAAAGCEKLTVGAAGAGMLEPP
jgi:hypothetical protein